MVCFGITVAFPADMNFLIVFFEPAQIPFESFNAFLKWRFPLPVALYKNYNFTLFESIKFFAQLLYMADFYCAAINYP